MKNKGNWGTWQTVSSRPSHTTARRCLDVLFLEVVKHNYKFYKTKLDDYPLRYNERVWSALIGAALPKVSPLFLAEYAVEREPKGRGHIKKAPAGRMDYWLYDEPHDIGLELKSTSHRLGTHRHKDVNRAWNSVVGQSKTTLKTMRQWGEEKSLSIAVLSVFVWAYEQQGKVFDFSFKSLRREIANFGLSPEPNWIGFWKPPHGHTRIKLSQPNRNEFATVIFLAHYEP
jgi:hypothetical protein